MAIALGVVWFGFLAFLALADEGTTKAALLVVWGLLGLSCVIGLFRLGASFLA